jgi:2-polyprenyl-6-methoxyphenol hydroxylase-like FAD-dependent oxidoreductase
MKTVLICGASVAGPALAYWLRRRGFAPTVVERAPALRRGGQAIDVRGVALDVIEQMDLLPAIRDLGTHLRGMSVLDGDGTELHRSTENVYSSGRLDSPDVELLREDLTALLYAHTNTDIEYVFGDSITALAQSDTGVRVEFDRADPREFDFVVGADGLHSTVRDLTFGSEDRFVRHLGTRMAVYGMDNVLGLDNWQLWLSDGAAGYAVYPVRDNTEIRVTLGFGDDANARSLRDVQQQKELAARTLDGLGWETPRLLEGMWDAPDFYADSMAQIEMDRWSRGRVALVGDAAYCPSPLSGQGTSLALVGAYALAEELGRTGGTHLDAFERYEQRMRPFVKLNQALATENPGGPASEASMEHAKNAFGL